MRERAADGGAEMIAHDEMTRSNVWNTAYKKG